MNQSKISVRYAKALFEAALDNNLLERVKNDVVNLKILFEQVKRLSDFIDSPTVKPSVKADIFVSMLSGGGFSNLTISFVNLLIKNRRETFLYIITLDFLELYRKHSGIKHTILTTADKIDDTVVKEIITTIEKYFDAKIDLEHKVDEKIIGGFILTVDDKQYNASVSYQLNKIKRNLINS